MVANGAPALRPAKGTRRLNTQGFHQFARLRRIVLRQSARHPAAAALTIGFFRSPERPASGNGQYHDEFQAETSPIQVNVVRRFVAIVLRIIDVLRALDNHSQMNVAGQSFGVDGHFRAEIADHAAVEITEVKDKPGQAAGESGNQWIPAMTAGNGQIHHPGQTKGREERDDNDKVIADAKELIQSFGENGGDDEGSQEPKKEARPINTPALIIITPGE